MKKIALTFALLLVIGVTGAQAQTTSTRSRTTITNTASPAPVTTTTAVTTAAPVTTLTGTSAASLTKGGQPVSGSVEMTMLMATLGLGVMGYSAYKAVKN